MIEVSHQGDVIVITVNESQLQMYVVPQFLALVEKAIQSHPKKIIFDLQNVEHIDSSAMGALFRFQKDAESWGGRIAVTHLSSKVAQVFRITKSEEMFSIYDSVEAALKSSG